MKKRGRRDAKSLLRKKSPLQRKSAPWKRVAPEEDVALWKTCGLCVEDVADRSTMKRERPDRPSVCDRLGNPAAPAVSLVRPRLRAVRRPPDRPPFRANC
jgi:hypothetical protein